MTNIETATVRPIPEFSGVHRPPVTSLEPLAAPETGLPARPRTPPVRADLPLHPDLEDPHEHTRPGQRLGQADRIRHTAPGKRSLR
jgi:hypothetical protein